MIIGISSIILRSYITFELILKGDEWIFVEDGHLPISPVTNMIEQDKHSQNPDNDYTLSETSNESNVESEFQVDVLFSLNKNTCMVVNFCSYFPGVTVKNGSAEFCARSASFAACNDRIRAVSGERALSKECERHASATAGGGEKSMSVTCQIKVYVKTPGVSVAAVVNDLRRLGLHVQETDRAVLVTRPWALYNLYDRM